MRCVLYQGREWADSDICKVLYPTLTKPSHSLVSLHCSFTEADIGTLSQHFFGAMFCYADEV